jgi:hypothetical protein
VLPHLGGWEGVQDVRAGGEEADVHHLLAGFLLRAGQSWVLCV